MSKDIIVAFKESGFQLSEVQISQFSTYRELLKEWNKVMNLTAIDDNEGILMRHFIDSCELLKTCEIKPSDKIIDVGTGAGFPGLPIAIVSKCHATLLDALNKRIEFLKAVCTNGNIDDVRCIHGRAEDYGRDETYREQFDYAVARAVANLTVLMEYTLPFVKVGGALIAHKATQTAQEIEEAKYAMELLGCQLESVINLPSYDGKDRTVVILRKVSSTPKKYPRKAGIPTKRPLIK